MEGFDTYMEKMEGAKKCLCIIEALGTAIKSFEEREAGISYVLNVTEGVLQTREEVEIVSSVIHKAVMDKVGVQNILMAWRECPIATSSGIIHPVEETIEQFTKLSMKEKLERYEDMTVQELMILSIVTIIAAIKDGVGA